MTSCGQQPLNVLAVLSLLISAGRTPGMLGGRWAAGAGTGRSFPGSLLAQPELWVLTEVTLVRS